MKEALNVGTSEKKHSICKKCGFELTNEDIYCPQCGEKLDDINGEISKKTEILEDGSNNSSVKKFRKYYSVLFIFLIILCSLVIFMVNRSRKNEKISKESDDIEQVTPSVEDKSDAVDYIKKSEDEVSDKGEVESKLEPCKFYNPSQDMEYEGIIGRYSIGSFNDKGDYSDFIGNIGAIAEVYKDIDIDGDGLIDEIDRQSEDKNNRKYSIKFGNGITIDGPEFFEVGENFTDYGEVIEFLDINKDGIAEVLFTQYEKFLRSKEVMVCTSVMMTRNDKGEWDMVDMLFPEKYSDSLYLIYGAELYENGVALLADYGTNNIGNCYDVFKFEMENGKFNLVANSPEYVKDYWPVKYKNSNTIASGLDDNSKNAFRAVLEDLYWHQVLPDGSSVGDHIADDSYSVYFGMTDYNGDGNKELRIKIDEEFKKNALVRIYAYSDEKGIYEIEEGYYKYDLNFINTRSKDVGIFEIAKYTTSNNQKDKAFVQAWNKNDWDNTDKWNYDFPDNHDKDGDGTVYSLMENVMWVYMSSDMDECWLDKYVYDKPELDEKINTLTNGADVLDEVVCFIPKGNMNLYREINKLVELN